MFDRGVLALVLSESVYQQQSGRLDVVRDAALKHQEVDVASDFVERLTVTACLPQSRTHPVRPFKA